MKKILVFGEVLFDVFENTAVIGGAPFNFAAHFSALGGKADFVSAVGQDSLGETALKKMEESGIGTAFVKKLDKPTGYCQVTLKNAVPRYDLKKEVAYDYIPLPTTPLAELKNSYAALYYGTLAQRSPVSKNTAEQLMDSFEEIFCDINIRPPFYSEDIIKSSIDRATVLKVSREEAAKILPYTDPVQFTNDLLAAYPRLKQVILTLDKDGAMVNDRFSGIFCSEKPTSKPVSTVGAGDSFGACYLWHRLNGDSIEKCLSAATLLSDYVVTQIGAVPPIPEELKRKLI